MRASLLTTLVSWVASLTSQTVAAAFVDASAFTSVTVEAPLFDTRLSASGGCDPSGCQGLLTRDGDETTLGSRWSCKPGLDTAGSTCSITYTLADSLQIYGINVAMYKGDSRTRSMDVYVDGVHVDSWTSSGTTTAFETIKLGFDYTSTTSSYTYDHHGIAGNAVELRGVLDDSEWLSIMEVEILVEDEPVNGTTDDGDDGSNSQTDTAAAAVEAGTVGAVTATAAIYDTRFAAANGCDPAGCSAALTRDGDLSTSSRWSCSPQLGGACIVSYSLGAVRDISELRLAMYEGTSRQRTIQVYVDGVLATTWTSSGSTAGFESIDLSGRSGEVVELIGVLTDSEWLSIVEAEIMVLPNDGITSTSTTSSTDGELRTVGMLPVATSSERMDPEVYYLKDGDLSTSWTCTFDPEEPDTSSPPIYYGCTIEFDLFVYRHIKHIKIAMPDGAERMVSFRIEGRRDTTSTEVLLTSSGETEGLETYDFDCFTDTISISGVFTGAGSGESISISEVEFVEQVFADEIPIGYVGVSIGLGQFDRSEGFAWASESNISGFAIRFELGVYAEVETIQLQFPVDDSYIFSVKLLSDVSNFPFSKEYAITSSYESSPNEAGWQSFDLSAAAGDQRITEVRLVMEGTGSGALGFSLVDARIIGTAIDNPTNTFNVGSTRIQLWINTRYPDFVASGTGDQKSIMEAICAVKQTSFDGVDCADGGDDAATGEVLLPRGDWYIDGNIYMKSGVYLEGSFSEDEDPGIVRFVLEEGAAGKTDIGAMLVMDGISHATVEDVWIDGLYDWESGSEIPAISGLGATGISIVNSLNVTCNGMEVRYSDGDGIVVRDSSSINIDAGVFDYQNAPLQLYRNRGTGLVVDSSDSIYVRRHGVEENGVAGIHITGSNNFTLFGPHEDESGVSGQAFVGETEGVQPIQVIMEASSLLTFTDVEFISVSEPAISISASTSGVTFDTCRFPEIDSGLCVIQADDPSVVTTGGDDELTLVGNCFYKV